MEYAQFGPESILGTYSSGSVLKQIKSIKIPSQSNRTVEI